jgi:ketosteroid isomerase-like protein
MTIIQSIVVALLAFTLSQPTGGSAMAQTKTEIEARNKALVQAGFEAWKAGTGSPFDLLADDASWTIVGNSDVAKTYPNKEAFLQHVIRPFNARMKEGIKPSIRGLYADGEAVIIFFDAAGMARDGRPYTNTYAWFFDMRDGKVIRAHAFFDSLPFNDLWRRLPP